MHAGDSAAINDALGCSVFDAELLEAPACFLASAPEQIDDDIGGAFFAAYFISTGDAGAAHGSPSIAR